MGQKGNLPEERIPTGISELDELIEGGIPRSFYLDLHEKRRGLGARLILWQIVSNFLKNGLAGIYACLDFPSEEIRGRLKSMSFDPEHYESTGDFTFLDFFSSKAKMFESLGPSELTTIEKLAYDPNEIITDILESVSRLDNVKNRGFLVVDSISSILVDAKVEDANRFVRGIRMLTRTHNLIGVSVSYESGVDPRALEMLHTNADGCMRIDEGGLQIERFSRTAFRDEKLKFVRTRDGALVIGRLSP